MYVTAATSAAACNARLLSVTPAAIAAARFLFL
jgi:hypothetical protein